MTVESGVMSLRFEITCLPGIETLDQRQAYERDLAAQAHRDFQVDHGEWAGLELTNESMLGADGYEIAGMLFSRADVDHRSEYRFGPFASRHAAEQALTRIIRTGRVLSGLIVKVPRHAEGEREQDAM